RAATHRAAPRGSRALPGANQCPGRPVDGRRDRGPCLGARRGGDGILRLERRCGGGGPGRGNRDGAVPWRTARGAHRGRPCVPDRAGRPRLIAMRYRLAVVLLLAGGCGGSHSSPLATSLEPVVAGGVPGAFVVVRDGDRTQSAAVGKIDPEARFRIGSVTKTFVATLALQLGLPLDGTVSNWLPGLLPDDDRITVRDLLAHRSGLPDVADDPAVLDGTR